jgi:hypothetical protein
MRQHKYWAISLHVLTITWMLSSHLFLSLQKGQFPTCFHTKILSVSATYLVWDNPLNFLYKHYLVTHQNHKDFYHVTCKLLTFWGLPTSGMWRKVIWQMCLDIWEQPVTSIINGLYVHHQELKIAYTAMVYVKRLLYTQFWAPDDGRKDCPQHVECFILINNLR